MEEAMTDTEDHIREFARVAPLDGSPELARFMAATRRLQDIAVSANPGEEDWAAAAAAIETVCARLEEHAAPEGTAPAGRATNLPGNGHPLMPPWQVAEASQEEVTMRGHFTRFHVGGNGAVHGGVIPLFYDWHFGMVVSAAGRPDSRTAYLHVDYRKVTPTDAPLVSRAWIDNIDGRKLFVRAVMTDLGGNVLSEASGLMIKLLPHQP
jgi:acyl-coenzyme A thioesterase PaaI-like protein